MCVKYYEFAGWKVTFFQQSNQQTNRPTEARTNDDRPKKLKNPQKGPEKIDPKERIIHPRYIKTNDWDLRPTRIGFYKNYPKFADFTIKSF